MVFEITYKSDKGKGNPTIKDFSTLQELLSFIETEGRLALLIPQQFYLSRNWEIEFDDTEE